MGAKEAYMSRTKKESNMAKSVSEQVAKEIKEVAENLKEPICDLVTNSVESSLHVVGTVASGVGEILGSVIDEASRLAERVRRGLEAAAR
jgi:hypothetical protein